MDRLEDDLRRVLTDPRRTLPPDLVTLEGVHRGATRRRRVRAAGAALATVVVLAGGVALGVTQLGGGGGDGSLPAAHSPSVSAPVTPTTGTTSTPSTATSQSAPTAIAAGLQPRSFTAIGTDTWFVLATDASCTSGHACGTRLLRTTDGGRTFRQLTAPPARWTDPGNGSIDTFSDVRFGSARDGWVFGGGLWSTHDGGRTWHRVSMPGRVVDVEAGAGVAWAVVDRSDGSRALMSSDVTVDGFADSTPSWATPSTLAVDGKHVVVWAGATSAAVPHGGKPSLLSTTDAGRSWDLVPTPSCSPDLGARVAASGGGVWLACPTGTAAAVFPSPLTDASAQLPSGPLGGGSFPNDVLVAPRDASTAALGLDADGIATVSSSGTVLHRSDVGGAPLWMGFTTPNVGYAIVSLDAGGSRLVRTTDGGATWTKVPLG